MRNFNMKRLYSDLKEAGKKMRSPIINDRNISSRGGALQGYPPMMDISLQDLMQNYYALEDLRAIKRVADRRELDRANTCNGSCC